jgi:hypothetical protein
MVSWFPNSSSAADVAAGNIGEPHDSSLRIRDEAFEWHRTNLVWS